MAVLTYPKNEEWRIKDEKNCCLQKFSESERNQNNQFWLHFLFLNSQVNNLKSINNSLHRCPYIFLLVLTFFTTVNHIYFFKFVIIIKAFIAQWMSVWKLKRNWQWLSWKEIKIAPSTKFFYLFLRWIFNLFQLTNLSF
jgi:hypothetical protein